MVTWYIQVYGLGKVGLYIHQSLHGWHTQGHRSKGARASYFGRPYFAVIPKSSGFRCKVYSVLDCYMGIGYNCICRVLGYRSIYVVCVVCKGYRYVYIAYM